MNILALDLAKQTGFSRYFSHGNNTYSGSKSFAPLRGQSVSALFGKWSIWIDTMLRVNEFNVVAYELIDWNIRSQHWREMYLGMTGILEGACFNHTIDCKGYTVRDIKLAATGQAKAEKSEMVRTARLMWPDQQIIDDNQADALWVLYVCMRDLDIAVKKHPEMLI